MYIVLLINTHCPGAHPLATLTWTWFSWSRAAAISGLPLATLHTDMVQLGSRSCHFVVTTCHDSHGHGLASLVRLPPRGYHLPRFTRTWFSWSRAGATSWLPLATLHTDMVQLGSRGCHFVVTTCHASHGHGSAGLVRLPPRGYHLPRFTRTWFSWSRVAAGSGLKVKWPSPGTIHGPAVLV